MTMILKAPLFSFFAVSGSKALQPVVLTLLIYTISLRLANTCFLHVRTLLHPYFMI